MIGLPSLLEQMRIKVARSTVLVYRQKQFIARLRKSGQSQFIPASEKALLRMLEDLAAQEEILGELDHSRLAAAASNAFSRSALFASRTAYILKYGEAQMQIPVSELTPELLSKVTAVWAIPSDGREQPCRVWDWERNLSPATSEAEARPTFFVSVVVPSLAAVDLEPLYAKLEGADAMGAKRLIRS